MPIRRETHPLLHFVVFHLQPSHQIHPRNKTQLSWFRSALIRHVHKYAENDEVLERCKNTEWTGQFYGWVFQLYKLQIVKRNGRLYVLGACV